MLKFPYISYWLKQKKIGILLLIILLNYKLLIILLHYKFRLRKYQMKAYDSILERERKNKIRRGI